MLSSITVSHVAGWLLDVCRALQRKYGSISLSPRLAPQQLGPIQGQASVTPGSLAGAGVPRQWEDDGASEPDPEDNTPYRAAWAGARSAPPDAADEEEDSTMNLRSQLIRTRHISIYPFKVTRAHTNSLWSTEHNVSSVMLRVNG